ncbi:MAG: hypothetical protein ACREN2_10990 [Candidatus Dormibacteria bacterium]
MPQDLDLPPEADEIFGALTDDGRRDFIHLVMKALHESHASGDLRPLQAVIEEFYRSLLVVRHPRYKGLRAAASGPPKERITAEEFRAKITD